MLEKDPKNVVTIFQHHAFLWEAEAGPEVRSPIFDLFDLEIVSGWQKAATRVFGFVGTPAILASSAWLTVISMETLAITVYHAPSSRP